MNAFKNILSSASKIVFIMMALGVHVALLTNRINGEQYMMLAGMAFTFYFANKGEAGGTSTSQTVTDEDGSSTVKTVSTQPPYAGK